MVYQPPHLCGGWLVYSLTALFQAFSHTQSVSKCYQPESFLKDMIAFSREEFGEADACFFLSANASYNLMRARDRSPR